MVRYGKNPIMIDLPINGIHGIIQIPIPTILFLNAYMVIQSPSMNHIAIEYSVIKFHYTCIHISILVVPLTLLLNLPQWYHQYFHSQLLLSQILSLTYPLRRIILIFPYDSDSLVHALTIMKSP